MKPNKKYDIICQTIIKCQMDDLAVENKLLKDEIADLKSKLEKEKKENNWKNKRVEEILFLSQLDENYNKELHKKILDAIFDSVK